MGVLEIKCPFTCKDWSLLDASKERLFLHQQSNEIMTFDTNHTYYYQVQAQIELCGAKYCDLVVWSENELHIERIRMWDMAVSVYITVNPAVLSHSCAFPWLRM